MLSEGGTIPLKYAPTLAYALSGLLAGLLVVSSVAGLLYGDRGLYSPYPVSLASLVGQDIVTLAVIVPLLLVSMWLARRGSVGGLFVWAGMLLWAAYFYFFYVVGGFNAFFLVYIAAVSSGLYGLLSLLFAVDPGALAARFGIATRARLSAGFLIAVALVFVLMWGGMIVASVTTGTRPDEVLRQVVIIDLTVMLPLLLFGGLRLWRRTPWGYLLGGLLLVKVAATGFTMAFTTALGAWWVRTVDPFQAFLFVLFALMMAGAVSLLFPYMHSIEGGSR